MSHRFMSRPIRGIGLLLILIKDCACTLLR